MTQKLVWVSAITLCILSQFPPTYPSVVNVTVSDAKKLRQRSTYYSYTHHSPRLKDAAENTSITFVPGEDSRPSKNVGILAAKIRGLRVEDATKPVSYEDSVSVVLADSQITIRFFGEGLTTRTMIRFVTERRPLGADCDDLPSTKSYEVKKEDLHGGSVLLSVHLPPLDLDEHEFYVCTKESGFDMPWVHQGGEPWLALKSYQKLLPLWAHILLLICLLMLSGILSGLNLGLMALDRTELTLLEKTGTDKERKCAKKIKPLRTAGNYLLCSILLGNTVFNSTLTILLDDITTGLIAVITSTMGIVIFAEIIPQAICSKYGLTIGAKTIYITKFFMFVTSPLSYPLSKILDCVLGEEIGSVYTRERLKELLRVTQDHHGLETEEIGIISGALEMKTKTVKDIMINLENVFMLPIDSVLDFDTVAYIEYQGYSRIPVYENSRNNIAGILNVKQLTLLDANDNIPLKTVVHYYKNQLFFVFENTRLDFMFRKFREGSMGHMAFVQRINDDGPGDPYYQTIGLVTFEDVLEELLQAEIMDESDIGKQEARLTKNRDRKPMYFQAFNRKKNKPAVEIPQPLALAAVQFLSTSIEPFKKEIISDEILQKLVRSCAEYVKVPKDKGNQHLPELFLYEAGKPCDHFVLILEGRVEVTVGKEKMIYEAGSFNTFGKDFFQAQLEKEKQAVSSPSEEQPRRKSFVPDYTVKVIADIHYLKIKFSAWKAAILATEIQRKNAGPNQLQNRNWEEEIDHVLEQGAAGLELTSPDFINNSEKLS